MAKSLYVLACLLPAAYLVSGRGVSEREEQTAEQLFSGIPPEAIGLICNTLCTDEDREADLLNALTSMRHELDEIKAKVTSTDNRLAAADLGSDRPEWKKIYPIYMVESPSGHYQLTQTEARTLCEETGGHLANRNQLDSAFNAGMDWCACGWVSEGYAAYPIQFPRDGCSVNTPPGIRTCGWQSTWNGWCIEGAYYQ